MTSSLDGILEVPVLPRNLMARALIVTGDVTSDTSVTALVGGVPLEARLWSRLTVTEDGRELYRDLE